jgi:hypothetical protein
MKIRRRLTYGAVLLTLQLVTVAVMLPGGWLEAVAAHAQQDGTAYDFEAGDLGDWLTQGQVAIVTSAIDPQTANTMQTVAQGSYSVRIGDETPWGVAGNQVSLLEREIVVPASAAPVIQFSYAVVANDPANHPQPDKPFFRLEVVDLTANETLPVSDFKYSSQTSGDWYLGSAPGNLGLPQSSFYTFGGDRWVFIPWKHEKVDLAGRGGHRLRISFILSDCNPNAHAAYGYFDNIRVGDEVALPPLPAPLGPLTPAGVPIDPGPLAGLLIWIEQNKIWPLVACLMPLLFLGLLGLGGYRVFASTRPPPPTRSDDDYPRARKVTNQGAPSTIQQRPLGQKNKEAGTTIKSRKPDQ